MDVLQPDEVFSDFSTGISESSTGISESSTGISESSTGISKPSLGLNGVKSVSNGIYRDEFGRLCTEKLPFPVIDDLAMLTESFRLKLFEIADKARDKKRLSPEGAENIILELCSRQFLTIGMLAQIMDRKIDTLRKRYLSPMVKANKLCLAFPTTPTHEKQAYRTNTEFNHIEN